MPNRKPWREVAVGDTVYIRNTNRSAWVGIGKDKVRDLSQQYSTHTVTEVGRQSIVLDAGRHSVSRIDGTVRGGQSYLSATLDMEGDLFIANERHNISHAVLRCDDADVLREIKRLLAEDGPRG